MAERILSDEASERKARSIARLSAEETPFIAHLPVIESESASLRRVKSDVVERLIALTIVGVRGATSDHNLSQHLTTEFDAAGAFTPQERAFLDDAAPTPQECVNFAWRYECAWVMLWALSFIQHLERPEEICDVATLASTLRSLKQEGLHKESRLRSQAELLDEADLVYRYHWAVRNARLAGAESVAGLNLSVVYERHCALNWLIGAGGAHWDAISTDT